MSILPLNTKTQTVPAEAKKPPPAPPHHLSKKMKRFWIRALESHNLQPYQIEILLKALEAYDRAEQARRILKREGLTYQDRFGQPRSRPEVAVERDARAQFAKLIDRAGLFDPYY
jgi:P27 family predicted phage terminase small subunit